MQKVSCLTPINGKKKCLLLTYNFGISKKQEGKELFVAHNYSIECTRSVFG